MLACCVITEMFEIESKHASKLLVTTTQRYSISPLEFAYKYQLMKFMASTPCQVTLSEIWMGEMKPQTSTWKVCIIILRLLYLGLIIYIFAVVIDHCSLLIVVIVSHYLQNIVGRKRRCGVIYIGVSLQLTT